MLRAGLVCLMLLGAAAAAPMAEEHSVQKRQTTVSEVGRNFNGGPINWTTVGLVILALLIVDVVGTAIFAAAFTGRESRDSRFPVVGEFFGNVYNSLDVVEAALTYMSVEEEACRFKAVCLAERAAVNNPFGALAINTINSHLSGLSKYGPAVEAGLNGEDCELLYDQCPDHIGF